MNDSMLKDRIGKRAFEICQGRGGLPGRDQEDWFQAEQEILDGEVGLDGDDRTRTLQAASDDEEEIEGIDVTWFQRAEVLRRPRHF